MTGRKWTDAPQEAWLKKQFPSFLQADSTATRKFFFTGIYTEWQKKFPDPEPSSDELTAAGGDCEAAVNTKRRAKDKQLKAWFDNHKRPTLLGKTNATISASRSVLILNRQRAWQPWQAYADLKYKDWKPEIVAQYNVLLKKWEEGHEEGEKKPIQFAFQNTFLKEKLEGESDEMKAKVEEHRLKMLEVPPEEVDRQYQIAIDKLPLTFATITDNIAKQTGWNIMIIAGGPCPNDEGRITTLIYTTGKTRDGRDYKDFLGEQLEWIEGPYDDFLHECFSADDCAARALCDGEHNEQVDDDDEEEGEEKVDETNEDTSSRDTSKKSKAKGKSKEVSEWNKSDYEIQREKNIAENQALLATIKNPEFEAAMGELKKGPAIRKKKNKGEKSRPDVEGRRTSARQDRSSKSTDGHSASSGKDAHPILGPIGNTDRVVESTGEKPEVEAAGPGETETPADEVPGGAKENDKHNNDGTGPGETETSADEVPGGAKGNNKNNIENSLGHHDVPADRPKENNNEKDDNDGSINSVHQHDVPADRPLSPGNVDHDGDVTMNDGSSHLRQNQESHGLLNQTPTCSILNVSADASPASTPPANASPSNVSSVNETPAVTTVSSSPIVAESPSQPPLAICIATASRDGPAPARSAPPTTDERPLLDGNFPGFLTPAIIAHLRGVSSTATWQSLVTSFLQFEGASPPIGKLSTTARPPEVAPWIKRHINKKHNPVTISDDYGARFRAWWTALQPSWRVTSSTSLSRAAPPKETWASLKKGGSAGLYIVVMALSWWVARSKAGSDNSQVVELVDDVSWVLSLVTQATPPSPSSSTSAKRRSPGSPDDKDSPPSKRVRT